MTQKQKFRMLAEYEVRSAAFWTWLCFNKYLQKLAADYLVWKTSRKLRSYNKGANSRGVWAQTILRITK